MLHVVLIKGEQHLKNQKWVCFVHYFTIINTFFEK